MKRLPLILLIALALCFQQGRAQSNDSLTITPNPFGATITFRIQLASHDTVTLDMFDITGRPIRTFMKDSLMAAGVYVATFSTNTLAEGVCFVRLKLGVHKQIMKKAMKVNTASGIPTIAHSQSTINLFPNPTTHVLTIPMSGIKYIAISDLNGRTCMTLQTDDNTVSLAGLPSGVYVVSVFAADQKLLTTEKIVKTEN